MSCIRWQYVPQEKLLELSGDPDFVLAKSLIVQGLAIKLGGPDAVRAEDLKLTNRPRESMKLRMEQEVAEERNETPVPDAFSLEPRPENFSDIDQLSQPLKGERLTKSVHKKGDQYFGQ